MNILFLLDTRKVTHFCVFYYVIVEIVIVAVFVICSFADRQHIDNNIALFSKNGLLYYFQCLEQSVTVKFGIQ